MLGKIKEDFQQRLFETRLTDLIDMEHPLVKLAEEISWDAVESEFEKLFSTHGRPSIPVRKIGGLLLLKEMFNESDESVVDRWIENPYWQHFTGEIFFQTKKPFDPSQFVHFRHRIGQSGLEFILAQTVKLHPSAENEAEIQIDSTVQEKNITFPTDAKLAKTIIYKCAEIARKENFKQRQTYVRVAKQLLRLSVFGRTKQQNKSARAARKKLKTIGKRVIRELENKLPPSRVEIYFEDFELFKKALDQTKNTKDKIYSLHEPQTACIAKGKAGKKYEFGTKVSIARGRKTGVVTAVTRFAGNPHDSKTLEETLDQCQRVREMAGGNRPKIAATDRGYKGATTVGGTRVIMPSTGKGKTRHQQRTESARCKDRAAIEPCISHLKNNHALGRNFLKGVAGDIHNALLAGIGYNLKLKLNKIKEQIVLWLNFILSYYRIFFMMRSGKGVF